MTVLATKPPARVARARMLAIATSNESTSMPACPVRMIIEDAAVGCATADDALSARFMAAARRSHRWRSRHLDRVGGRRRHGVLPAARRDERGGNSPDDRRDEASAACVGRPERAEVKWRNCTHGWKAGRVTPGGRPGTRLRGSKRPEFRRRSRAALSGDVTTARFMHTRVVAGYIPAGLNPFSGAHVLV